MLLNPFVWGWIYLTFHVLFSHTVSPSFFLSFFLSCIFFWGKLHSKLIKTFSNHLKKIQYSETYIHKSCELINCLLIIILSVWKHNLKNKISNVSPGKPVTTCICGALQLSGNRLKQASCQETNTFSGKIPQQPPKSLTLQLSSKACISTMWLLPLKERRWFSRAACYTVHY